MWSVAAIVTLEPVTWARIRRPQVRLAGAVVRRKSVSTKGGERAFSIFAEPQGRRKCCSDNRPHPTASGHDADVGVKWKVQSRWRAVISANLTPRKCLGFKTPFQAALKELGKDVQIRSLMKSHFQQWSSPSSVPHVRFLSYSSSR
jgi:hypothetical protein